MKVGKWRDSETNAAPEYEDVRKRAEEHGVPAKTVYMEAVKAYEKGRA